MTELVLRGRDGSEGAAGGAGAGLGAGYGEIPAASAGMTELFARVWWRYVARGGGDGARVAGVFCGDNVAGAGLGGGCGDRAAILVGCG